MAKKPDPQMTDYHKQMVEALSMKYKRPLWDRFKDAMGVSF